MGKTRHLFSCLVLLKSIGLELVGQYLGGRWLDVLALLKETSNYEFFFYPKAQYISIFLYKKFFLLILLSGLWGGNRLEFN